MNKKLTILAIIFLVALFVVNIPLASAKQSARKHVIKAGADRIVELQRTDTGWEGTWFWYVGNTYNATNLTGVTALGLLEAYRDVRDREYLEASKNAADFILKHLGLTATETQYHHRCTAPDVIFLHKLSMLTGDPYYRYRATVEWYNITVSYATADDLDYLFRSTGRRSAWDMAFFLEAAHLSGDEQWADGAAAILADFDDAFYYGTDTWWYALNLAGAIRALVACGYYCQYKDEVAYLLDTLVALVDEEDGINGYIQDTAYAVLAFERFGWNMKKYARQLVEWLAGQQEDSGGWLEEGTEYPEVNGEAVRAIASTADFKSFFRKGKAGLGTRALKAMVQPRKMAAPFNGEGR